MPNQKNTYNKYITQQIKLVITRYKIYEVTKCIKHKIIKFLYFLGLNYRYLIILTLLYALHVFLIEITDLQLFNKKEVLSLLISISSIITAILITYIFGKLFSDKSKRIDIKKSIDNLAVVINNFRNLIFRLRQIDSLWQVDKTYINHKVRQKYPTLTVNDYRDNLPYEEFIIVEKDLNYTMGQTYLAMKGFADGDESLTSYSDTNYRNFTVEDIERYIENTHFIWGYLDEISSTRFSPDSIHSYWYDRLDEYYFKIRDQRLNRATFKDQIKDLMTYMQESILQKHYYYNSLIQQPVPKSYIGLLINIFVLLLIIVIALLVFIIEFTSQNHITIFLIALFISNVVDLTCTIYSSIKSELNIEERYSV